MEHLTRIVESALKERLDATGAVVVEGPRACGKATTARTLAASEVRLDGDLNARQMVGVSPDTVLAGPTPRLIAEWQTEPDIWNHVRRAVDDRRAPGQFILTGSSVPAPDMARHTGTGRLTRLRMRPLSLFEAGLSSGQVSLHALLDGEPQGSDPSTATVPEVAELVCRGGWPGNVGRPSGGTPSAGTLSARTPSAPTPSARVPLAPTPLARALRRNRVYLGEIRRADISRVSGRRRDPARVGRLLRSLARNVATPASLATLVKDGRGRPTMKPDTASEYLEALERLMIVEDLPAWTPRLRSRTRLRTKPTRHFADPSLAVAALRATPQRLMDDLEFFALLFRSLVIRDLRVYAQTAEAEVYHYREKAGLEVDAVVECDDGRWAAFEVKLGDRWVDKGAASLRRLADRMIKGGRGAPSALAVVIPNGYGHVPHGDVGVVPIGALGP